MAVVEKTVLVPFTAEQMFDLVDEVERYPEFLPWCGRSHVEFRDGQTTRATLQINYHGIKQSFSTQNDEHAPRLDRYSPGKRTIPETSWKLAVHPARRCGVQDRILS